MKKIILATQNRGKIREFKQMMAKYEVEVLSLLDINYTDEIEETGMTFEENALIKAREIALKHHAIVIADDSGLTIDELNGEPGVYSARYAGQMRSDEDNIDKVLIKLKDVPSDKRTAQFVCVLATVDEVGKETIVRGVCEGEILYERRGLGGFGYDPIFYLPELEKTMAQLSDDEKNAISHRALAFKKLETMIGELI